MLVGEAGRVWERQGVVQICEMCECEMCKNRSQFCLSLVFDSHANIGVYARL